MLVHEGQDRSESQDRRLACLLSSLAGALNAVAFYSVGFFSANMTGNLSLASDQMAVGHFANALFYLSILGVFILGAMVSTLLISYGRHRGWPYIYAAVLGLEACLMLALGGFEVLVQNGHHVVSMVLGLSGLMGLQNAVVTRISQARIRTTHISGMATDLGIECGLMLESLWQRGPNQEAREAVLSRFNLHLQTILSFMAGGLLGVIAYQRLGALMICLCAVGLMLIAFLPIVSGPKAKGVPTETGPNDL